MESDGVDGWTVMVEDVEEGGGLVDTGRGRRGYGNGWRLESMRWGGYGI